MVALPPSARRTSTSSRRPPRSRTFASSCGSFPTCCHAERRVGHPLFAVCALAPRRGLIGLAPRVVELRDVGMTCLRAGVPRAESLLARLRRSNQQRLRLVEPFVGGEEIAEHTPGTR